MKILLSVMLLAAIQFSYAQKESLESRLKKNSTIKDFGLKKYIYSSKDLPHVENKTWNLVCQMPYNCHFQMWIELEGNAGDSIKLNSSNPLVRYLTPTESFVTKGGIQTYEAKNWVSGEGAMYTIPAGVKVKSVQYRETGFDTEFAGSFECDDNDYNILWKKGARTAYLCMRDWFYDCPDRERVGFWGDGTPEMNQCFYAFDSKSHRLAKELVLRPLDAKFYPGQQMEFLGEYGLWYYYLQTGDIESIKSVYDSTKSFLFKTYKPGNKKQWYDWGKDNKDIAVIETCFMYIDLGTLKKIALLSGHASDTMQINAKLDSIKNMFHKRFWKGSFYMSEQVPEPDDRANAMAINAGLADKSTWESIYENVLTKKTFSSSFFDRWVFEALCFIGKEEYALLRMSNRYRTMIPASFTTLWEHYDRWWASWIDAFDDASSLNHGWNPPVINLSQTIAGISPIEPGWNSFHVLPKEAFLKKINVVVPSIKGNINVSINKSATQYSIKVNAPTDTKALIGIPKKSFSTLKTIKVNGTLIWNKKYIDGVKGISWNAETEYYIMFWAESGTLNFLAEGILPLSSPKIKDEPTEKYTKLEKKNWTATASVKDSLYLFSGDKIPIEVPAENAIDGDHWTGWRDMTKKQYGGQWFMVDMKKMQTFDKIELDNTWALWDSPKKYSVVVSNDGKKWSKPIAEGSGPLGITHIVFPRQTARFIKIIQNGTDEKYNWSIFEMDVLRKN
jgi:hypothetical protein